MASETSDHLELQEDLLNEIFLRSSVKSLLFAKCVCKPWNALIRNRNFVIMHLHYQKSHYKGRLLLQYFKEDTEQYKYALFNDETLVSNSYHDLDHFQLPYYVIHMEGPVNGLYCLFDGCDRVILWNPALMELRIVPSPPTHFYPHHEHHKGVIGFGLDPFTNDYKLVLIRYSFDENVQLYVTVYNLTTNTWKLLNCDDFDLIIGHSSIGSSFLSGSYYWSTWDGEVIAFDMGEETFRHILGPDLALPKSAYYYYVTIYNNNKVAFLQEYNFSIDVWVMLEESIWVKQFSIISFTNYFLIVGILKNNELLLAVDGAESSDINLNFPMVLCRATNQEMRNVGPKGNPTSFRASIYYESLVSVEGGMRHRGKCASLKTISDFLR